MNVRESLAAWPTACLIARDGDATTDPAAAAWLVLREGDPRSPVWTVRQPSQQVWSIVRDQADPHPDDPHYLWPGLGSMAALANPQPAVPLTSYLVYGADHVPFVRHHAGHSSVEDDLAYCAGMEVAPVGTLVQVSHHRLYSDVAEVQPVPRVYRLREDREWVQIA